MSEQTNITYKMVSKHILSRYICYFNELHFCYKTNVESCKKV